MVIIVGMKAKENFIAIIVLLDPPALQDLRPYISTTV